MLDEDIIRPDYYAWSFPVVIETKRDGTPRFCVDYREFNARIKGYLWTILKIQEISYDLEGGRVFTTLYLFSGYWQVRLREDCKEKTKFVCRYGT